MRLPTALVWSLAVCSLAIGALVATIFVLMATSMGPEDLLKDGLDAWQEAGIAVGTLVGLAIVDALGLWVWHRARFKLVGASLVLAGAAGVAWACARVWTDYF